MSACVRYLEVMLPVDDLKGASRAIAPGPERARRYTNQGAVHARSQRRKSGSGERQQHYTADWIPWSVAVVESEMLRGLERSESAWVCFLLRLDG
jgi:hypothetical protein